MKAQNKEKLKDLITYIVSITSSKLTIKKNNIFMMVLVFLFGLEEAQSCLSYMQGKINNKYEIVMNVGDKYSNTTDRLNYYYYVNQINKATTQSERDKLTIHLSDASKTKFVEYEKHYFEVDKFSYNKITGSWVSGKTGTAYPFMVELDIGVDLKIAQYQMNGKYLHIWRRHLDNNDYLISISLDDGEKIPFLLSDCFLVFSDTEFHVKNLNAKHNLWRITIESEGQGNGNYTANVSAVYKFDNKPKLIAWKILGSGGSGSSGIGFDATYDFRGDTLVKIVKSSSFIQSDDGVHDTYSTEKQIFYKERNGVYEYIGGNIEQTHINKGKNIYEKTKSKSDKNNENIILIDTTGDDDLGVSFPKKYFDLLN